MDIQKEEQESGYTPSDAEVASNPRMSLMDQLSEKSAQIAFEDSQQMGLLGGEPEGTGGRDKAPAEKAPVADPATDPVADQVAATMNDAVLIDDPARARVKVKLDGEEREMSLDQVLRGFQKEAVATRRLNEATQKLREADEILARAKAGQSAGETVGQTKGADAPAATDANEQAEHFINALLSGDDENAKAILSSLLNGRTQGTAPSATELAEEVKRQLDVDAALKEFERDHGDVIADPYLAGMTNGYLAEEIAAGNDYRTALSTAATRTREWMASIGAASSKTNEPSTTTHTDRAGRKRDIDTIRAASARAGANTLPQEESATSVIQEMRKARGQAV